jgi:hypothetical protein
VVSQLGVLNKPYFDPTRRKKKKKNWVHLTFKNLSLPQSKWQSASQPANKPASQPEEPE